MKHVFLFFSFIVSTITSLKSQDSSSLLQQYKYRTPGFRALQLNLNAGGDIRDAKLVSADDTKGSQFNSAFQLEYYRIISTDKRQHQTSIVFNPSFNQIKNESGQLYSRLRNLSLQTKWNRSDRFYFNNSFFFEIGNEFETGGNRQKTAGNYRENKWNNNLISDKIIIGVGKGRIENVQDAQMALFIVNDLRRSGLLSKEPDAATLYELATLVTDINNRRVFDNRIRRKYELTRIDSFFQSKQLINAPSIAYFTTLNDNWALAFNPGRLRGTRVYVHVNPGISFSDAMANQLDTNVNTFKSHSKTLTYFYEPKIGIEHHKPIGLHWQRNVTASLAFRQSFTRQNSKVETSGTVTENEWFNTLPELVLKSFYGAGYFPNNRTVVNAGLNFEAMYAKGFLGNFDSQYYVLSPGIQVNADYFINYRTRLFLSAGLNYRYTEVESQLSNLLVFERNVVTGNFNFGLTHSIF